jgi:hypothetical protein
MQNVGKLTQLGYTIIASLVKITLKNAHICSSVFVVSFEKDRRKEFSVTSAINFM